MKRHQRLLSLVLISLLALTGCDKIQDELNKPPKGSVDAVVSCIANNAHKKDVLRESFIDTACLEKHQLSSSENPSRQCSARVTTGADGTSTVRGLTDECVNATDRIVVALGVKISVYNLPLEGDDTGKTIVESAEGRSKSIKIYPKESFRGTTISIRKDWPDQVTGKTPHCSDKPEEICKSWSITGYDYLNPNI